VFVNLSPSGMYDKTIFEAAACGALSVASSDDFAREADPRLSFPAGDAAVLAARLEALFDLPETEKEALRRTLVVQTAAHGLAALVERLSGAIQ
jgi:hypothetical protein